MEKKLEGVYNEGYLKDIGENGKVTENESRDSNDVENQKPARQNWDHPIEFLLSCISLSVGLGNVWRFPFVAYENGGGAFLIPYLIVLFFIGKPFYYMELVMGQFSSSGSVKVWDMVPAFRGIGYAQCVATYSVVTYYVVLMALTVFYTFSSFSKELPWARCPDNLTFCVDKTTNHSMTQGNESVTSSEIYFVNEVWKIHADGLDDGIFLPDWRLVLCLLFAWVLVFVTLYKGVKSSGKASYFTAIFPYVILFMLVGKGVTLPGATKGIMYFLSPKWEKLLEPEVWFAAVSQSFFSLAVLFGSIVMFSSYSPFTHNIYRDATIISLTDTFTSLLAGLTIFAILGHSAETMGIDDIQQVIKGGGTSLAFISYPDVIARFTWMPQLFSVCFFMMLFTLGLGSATALIGVVITVICDNFPSLKRSKVAFWVCLSGFCCGLFYCTPQGPYLVDLIDYYGGSFGLYIVGIFEIIAVQWIYGFDSFIRDIEFMLRRKTGLYWKFCWKYFIPIVLMTVFVYKMIVQKPLKSGSYVFGPIANGIGLLLAGISVGMLPLCFLLAIYKNYQKCNLLSEAVWLCFRPSSSWGPKDPIIRKQYMELINSEGSLKLTESKKNLSC